VAAAPPPVLPDPPIPTQHITGAGIKQCVGAVDQVSKAALLTEYNAQSLWNQANPSQHVFQSVAGIKNTRNNPSTGMVAIIAAPTAADKCDAVAVEVYPLAGTCTDVQKLMAKGGEVETSLEDLKVITDAQ
jgi:hypothetical protein